MTKKATRTTSNGNGSGARPSEPDRTELAMAMNGGSIDDFAKACQACFCGWARINGELADFMSRRLSRDAELSASLAQCQSWDEVARLQQSWARVTAEDYAEEANRLMDLTSTLAADTWKPMFEQAEAATKDGASSRN